MNWLMNSSLESKSQPDQKPTMAELRAKVNPFQKKLLDEFWQHFCAKGEWPLTRVIYSTHGTDNVKKALSPIGGSVVSEENHQSGRTMFQLKLLGVLLTTEGPAYQNFLLRYFDFQRNLFQKQPEKQQIKAEEIAADLKLSPEETELLGQLISYGGFYGGVGSRGNKTWTVSDMKEMEAFPLTGDLSPNLEKCLMQHYTPDSPVFEEERGRRRLPHAVASHFIGNQIGNQGASHDSIFIPVAIQDSLKEFQKDHPQPERTAFIMMQFANTSAHTGIEAAIKATLAKYGYEGLLARDKEYNEEVLPNIQTYLHGCAFGIAVFERIEADNFNPNVSLEVGYMMGHKKKVLLLKDKNLKLLQTDLVGRLYREFDVLDPAKTIPIEIEGWMEDKGLI
jgi:hypothetical protein